MPHDMGAGEDVEKRFKDAAAKESNDNASQQKAQAEAAGKQPEEKAERRKSDKA